MSRKLLYGLGIGLIVGAVLVRLMLAGETDVSTTPTPMSLPDNWKELAADEGYVILTKQELTATKPIITETTSDITSYTVIYIAEGMQSSQVARLLQEAGLVTDSGLFLDELDRLKMTTKIQYGYYKFTLPITMEDIIRTITRVPLSSSDKQ